MTDSIPSEQTAASPPSSASHDVTARPAVTSGAHWFWWIAGLSIVNIALFQSGSDTSFVVGLSMTTFADAIFSEAKIIGFAIDAIIIGFFVFVGLRAKRGKLWAFYLGLVVYVLDALIYAAVGGWMSVAFHGLAIFYIVKGLIALRNALKNESPNA
jgi:hypothetical protein